MSAEIPFRRLSAKDAGRRAIMYIEEAQRHMREVLMRNPDAIEDIARALFACSAAYEVLSFSGEHGGSDMSEASD